MYFDPAQLRYCGNRSGMAIFRYQGICVTASVSSAYGSRSIAVGVGAAMPNTVLPGLLSWFGVDTRRSVDTVRYMDNSRCYIQRAA